MKRTIAVLSATAAAALVAAGAGPAQAAPPSDGCPSNWYHLNIDTDLQGYLVPSDVDSPANRISFGHQSGNGNRWVCALPLGNQTTGSGKQLFNFMDDSLKAEG